MRISYGGILEKLRVLVAPPDLVGGCGNTPSRHLRRYDYAEGPAFKDEAALNDWLLGDMHSLTPSPTRETFRSRMRADHRIVLTHGDLS